MHEKSKGQKDLTELKLPKCMKLKDEWQLKLPAASIMMGIHSVLMCFTCFQLDWKIWNTLRTILPDSTLLFTNSTGVIRYIEKYYHERIPGRVLRLRRESSGE